MWSSEAEERKTETKGEAIRSEKSMSREGIDGKKKKIASVPPRVRSLVCPRGIDERALEPAAVLPTHSDTVWTSGQGSRGEAKTKHYNGSQLLSQRPPRRVQESSAPPALVLSLVSHLEVLLVLARP